MIGGIYLLVKNSFRNEELYDYDEYGPEIDYDNCDDDEIIENKRIQFYEEWFVYIEENED